MILVVLLKRILGTIPLRDHNLCHPLTSGVMWRIWFSRNLCRQMEYFFSLSLWHETFVVGLLARFMGAKIGRSVMISSCSGLFSEAERIMVGDSAVIEYGARICATAFVNGSVMPTNTVIGNNCIVGVKGIVEAGARMKPDLVVQPRRTTFGAIIDSAILRSFPKPSTFVYLPIVIWIILAHTLALMPLVAMASFTWNYMLQSGSLPSWDRNYHLQWAMIRLITSIAIPSLASLPVCSLLYFFEVAQQKHNKQQQNTIKIKISPQTRNPPPQEQTTPHDIQPISASLLHDSSHNIWIQQ